MVINFVMFLKQVDLYMHSSISNDDPEVAVMLEQCRVRLRDQINRVAEVKLLCIVQCIYIYNPSNLFAYARLAWTHHVTKYSPAKTGDIREYRYSPIFRTAHIAKKIWRIIKIIVAIWGENMLGYFSLDIICSS